VVLCGVAAWLLARGADSVYALVESSSAFGSSGVLVILAFAFTRLGGSVAAAAALIAGAATWIAGSTALALQTPYLGSLAVAVLAYLVGGALDPWCSRLRSAWIRTSS
jgi:hypothetical protein